MLFGGRVLQIMYRLKNDVHISIVGITVQRKRKNAFRALAMILFYSADTALRHPFQGH
jgi:hypothetical protein